MKHLLIALMLSFSFLQSVDIAVTIDDFPCPSDLVCSPEEKTHRYIAACAQHKCQAAFFCLGAHCKEVEDSERYLALLSQYGHFLANHSMTHSKLSSQSLEDFEQEVNDMDMLLEPYYNKRCWYRFPALDAGNIVSLGGSQEKRAQALQILAKLGYQEAPITINTFDWHVNARMFQAIKGGMPINYEVLKELYLHLVHEWCSYYIDLYKQHEMNITHILLLHANELNALYLGDILAMIKDSGWNIVSPEEAFKDTSWRERAIATPGLLSSKPKTLDPRVIDQLLEERKVFKAIEGI